MTRRFNYRLRLMKQCLGLVPIIAAPINLVCFLADHGSGVPHPNECSHGRTAYCLFLGSCERFCTDNIGRYFTLLSTVNVGSLFENRIQIDFGISLAKPVPNTP